MGLLTLLLAACSALNQHDIKRILAYSTISQIGYMFLALGVGAWSAGIFHLMTHAFFKALLFLGAGAVLYSLRGEHDISRMGGLRSRLPIVFWSFLIGSAALSALPFTSGFFSKDEIVAAAFNYPGVGPWLWAGAILGALLTGLYSFRLVFLVFFGEAKTEPDRSPGWRMFWPLAILCCFALVGGWIVQPLGQVFPAAAAEHPPGAIIWIDIAIPIAGVLLAYFIFLGRQLSVTTLMNSPLGRSLHQFWYQGWRIDELYDRVWVRPYRSIARALHNEPVDQLYNVVVRICSGLNSLLSASQNGRMRWYIIAMVVGVVVLLAMMTQGLKPGVQ
jgi:NADH-quinone oxidoreductase subunit L